jgi:hypothetical protein
MEIIQIAWLGGHPLTLNTQFGLASPFTWSECVAGDILWGLAETKSDQLGKIMPRIKAVFELKEGNKHECELSETGGREIEVGLKTFD